MQMAVDLEGHLALEEPRAAEDAMLVRLADRVLDDAGLMVVLAADEEVRGVELTRPAGDRDALEDQMGIEVAEQAILEGPRLRLVAVDGEIATASVGRRHERPLQARREARAATTTKHGGLDGLDDLRRLLIERRLEGLVAFGRDVPRVVDGAAFAGIAPRWRGDALGERGSFEGHGGGRRSGVRNG